VGTLGLRYGLTAKTEIFARTSYLHNSSRSSDVSGISSHSESRFADAWADINYQFKKDDDTPASLGVGYGISKGGTVNLTFKSNVSGSNGGDLRLNWLHTF
jgi:hypothetical protein